jgi:DDE domain/Resolvase, N terminal domain
MVTRPDRLARSTHDLLNTLDTIAKAGAGFRSLATYGRTRRPRQGKGRENGAEAEAHRPPEARSDQPPRHRRTHAEDCAELRSFAQLTWHLDEVYLKIDGRMVYLWRAVDARLPRPK